MLAPTPRRSNAPAPVLIFNNHHYPAIHVVHANARENNSNAATTTTTTTTKQNNPRPYTPPPSRKALQAHRSPGLPIPSPLAAGGLPSPVLPLGSASSYTTSSSSASPALSAKQ